MKTITELARMWKNKKISTSSLKKELKEVEFFVFPEEPELFQQFEAIVIETLGASNKIWDICKTM